MISINQTIKFSFKTSIIVEKYVKITIKFSLFTKCTSIQKMSKNCYLQLTHFYFINFHHFKDYFNFTVFSSTFSKVTLDFKHTTGRKPQKRRVIVGTSYTTGYSPQTSRSCYSYTRAKPATFHKQFHHFLVVHTSHLMHLTFHHNN